MGRKNRRKRAKAWQKSESKESNSEGKCCHMQEAVKFSNLNNVVPHADFSCCQECQELLFSKPKNELSKETLETSEANEVISENDSKGAYQKTPKVSEVVENNLERSGQESEEVSETEPDDGKVSQDAADVADKTNTSVAVETPDDPDENEKPCSVDDDAEQVATVCVCLRCGYIACSRQSPHKHALEHYKAKNSHPVVVNLSTWVVWCYKCDDEVDPDVSFDIENCLSLLKKALATKAGKLDKQVPVRKKNVSSCVSFASGASAVKGLANLGNTCFFNSVMQNLCQTQLLRLAMDHLLLGDFEYCILPSKDDKRLDPLSVVVSGKQGPLTLALARFLQDMVSDSKKHVINPGYLFTEICKKAPRFKGFRQQDSQELLRYLLDSVRTEEIKDVKRGILRSFDVQNSHNKNGIALENVDNDMHDKIRLYGKYAGAPVIDTLFGGQLVSSVECLACRKVSTLMESFFDLSLSLNIASPSLSNCHMPKNKGQIHEREKNAKKEENEPSGSGRPALSKNQQKKRAKEAKKSNCHVPKNKGQINEQEKNTKKEENEPSGLGKPVLSKHQQKKKAREAKKEKKKGKRHKSSICTNQGKQSNGEEGLNGVDIKDTSEPDANVVADREKEECASTVKQDLTSEANDSHRAPDLPRTGTGASKEGKDYQNALDLNDEVGKEVIFDDSVDQNNVLGQNIAVTGDNEIADDEKLVASGEIAEDVNVAGAKKLAVNEKVTGDGNVAPNEEVAEDEEVADDQAAASDKEVTSNEKLAADEGVVADEKVTGDGKVDCNEKVASGEEVTVDQEIVVEENVVGDAKVAGGDADTYVETFASNGNNVVDDKGVLTEQRDFRAKACEEHKNMNEHLENLSQVKNPSFLNTQPACFEGISIDVKRYSGINKTAELEAKESGRDGDFHAKQEKISERQIPSPGHELPIRGKDNVDRSTNGMFCNILEEDKTKLSTNVKQSYSDHKSRTELPNSPWNGKDNKLDESRTVKENLTKKNEEKMGQHEIVAESMHTVVSYSSDKSENDLNEERKTAVLTTTLEVSSNEGTNENIDVPPPDQNSEVAPVDIRTDKFSEIVIQCSGLDTTSYHYNGIAVGEGNGLNFNSSVSYPTEESVANDYIDFARPTNNTDPVATCGMVTISVEQNDENDLSRKHGLDNDIKDCDLKSYNEAEHDACYDTNCLKNANAVSQLQNESDCTKSAQNNVPCLANKTAFQCEDRIETKDEYNSFTDLNEVQDLKTERRDLETANSTSSVSEVLSGSHSLGNMRAIGLNTMAVEGCLKRFCSPEMLDGNNKFICEECNRQKKTDVGEELDGDNDDEDPSVSGKTKSKPQLVYTDAVKQLLIYQPPPILTLHLKRFHQVGFALKKLPRHIDFPLVLDLAPFCHRTSKVATDSEGKVLYSLCGVVEHSGGLNSGHYTAYCRLSKPCSHFFQAKFESLTGLLEAIQLMWMQKSGSTYGYEHEPPSKARWFHISDSHVSEVNEQRVLKAQAYLLFYERMVLLRR